MIIIFYGMKSIVLFVAASLMLVGAAVVVAIPIQVEAEWCFSFSDCFNSRSHCAKISGTVGPSLI
jgi:hypothetical protein